MSTIKNNLRIWDSIEHWEAGVYGDGVELDECEKWSRAWGNSRAQWQITLLPRIEKFLWVPSILELLPGRGRWTQYLKEACDRLTIVDLSEICIEYCKMRFSDCNNIVYLVTNGRTLSSINDSSVNFMFSFESMVHVDVCDLESYISELKRVLKCDGAAFIHHSNLGAYQKSVKSSKHLRATDVSAALVSRFCNRVGLHVLRQECVLWTADHRDEGVMIDCFTTITANGESDTNAELIENVDFLLEQERAQRWLAGQYNQSS